VDLQLKTKESKWSGKHLQEEWEAILKERAMRMMTSNLGMDEQGHKGHFLEVTSHIHIKCNPILLGKEGTVLDITNGVQALLQEVHTVGLDH
jgi:hypothetical protein